MVTLRYIVNNKKENKKSCLFRRLFVFYNINISKPNYTSFKSSSNAQKKETAENPFSAAPEFNNKKENLKIKIMKKTFFLQFYFLPHNFDSLVTVYEKVSYLFNAAKIR